ncbi:HAMP domain-containing sensor histidine kinase [Hyphomicrobium sp.]|uniref:sensor histidine kinase n=1 Tax=Hyphomicrobium sp. TaxID=82 RepID=UPI002E313C8B|nr:HAMP domain-containing sensor histidine kinase [Hyphomicrobium sp.]HEX2840841.1 HAMP domain-containing sensor histidine kinase [Hyphomicrobium sp.]
MSRRPVVQFDKDLPASVVAPLEADGRAVVCLIDVGAGRILAANEEGAAALGLHATSTEPMLDAAMPALAQLRALAPAPAGRRVSETLLFWTRDGTLRLPCQIQIIETGSRVVAIVVSDNAPALKGPEPSSPPRELLAGDDAAKLREIARRIREGQTVMGQGQRGDPDDTTVQTDPYAIGRAHPDRAPLQTQESPTLRASLAHELKTPLSAIATAAEIMKAERFGPLGAERYVGYAADIYGSAQHVLGVIDRMLAEGSETLEGQLDFAQIAVGDILKASASQMAPLAERAGIALDLDVPQRLPHLIADATSLRQMVFNLLTNALKFTARDGRVVLSAHHSGDGPLEISIADTGCGMSPQQIERLLGRAQAPRRKPRADANDGPAGLGLGLPLVQTLATANGAELVLESEPGKGTSASIVFRKDRVVPV